MNIEPPGHALATFSYMPHPTTRTELASVFTHADARGAGWSDRDLYAARDRGDILRVARGIYAEPDLSADFDLVEIAIRAPQATMCLTSVLAHHDLTDDIPASINVALPRSRRAPRTQAPANWHRFDDDTFDIGREELPVVDHLTIGIYSPARSVIDAYRLRHLYGTEQATDALKRWLNERGNQPAELLELAGDFPAAEPAIRNALQTLL